MSVIHSISSSNTARLHAGTPRVTVFPGLAGKAADNRRSVIRTIDFCCHPDTLSVKDALVTRHRHDARGFLTHSTGPRLHRTGRVSFTYVNAPGGSLLRAQGADNGTRITLSDAAGRPLAEVSGICTADDGTSDRSLAVARAWHYEDDALPGRPLSVSEQAAGESARVPERFTYAGRTDAHRARNLAGACVSQCDTAGLLHTGSAALTGVTMSVTRRLLKDADNPHVQADWQGENASAWSDLLTADGEGYTTLTIADATGAVLAATDAEGNLQRATFDVAGLLSGSRLTLRGGREQVIVASLTYSATGQTLRKVHGNGVVTSYAYAPQTQRLSGIKTERPAGHPSGAGVLQDLRCVYDPGGNVLRVRNDAEATRFWRNQKVAPESTYAYDSLYRLVRASGREMAGAGQQGSGLPSPAVPLAAGGSEYTGYVRTYAYDADGNLTQICHCSPATDSSYTTDMTVSDRSNRAVLSTLTDSPAEVDALFTAGGQQKQLMPGQHLIWTPRSELLRVSPIRRGDEADDSESYRYDGGSRRILKMNRQKTGGSTQTRRTLYLPGLELRSTCAGSAETERLQVITVGEAGRGQVRALHRDVGRPDGITSDALRYSCDSLTGSSGLELDDDGKVISLEEYYPYGGTAVWTARGAAEADGKTVRYSGKERDATGLYYYGYRYYQPWAGRWLSADPAGTADGLNLFRMCRNNPVTLKDSDGRFSEREREQTFEALVTARNSVARAIYILDAIPHEAGQTMRTFFGEKHEDVRENVLSAWSASRNILGKYIEVFQEPGQYKIIREESDDPKDVALWNDMEKAIYVFDGFFTTDFNANKQAAAMIHEATHVDTDPDINSQGADSRDHYYLADDFPEKDSEKTLNGTGIRTSRFHAVKDTFKKIASIRNYSIDDIRKVQQYKTREVKMWYNGNNVMTLSDVVVLFNSDKELQAQVAADNADSLAYAAIDLGNRFESIIQKHSGHCW
ncbi:insecticidal toxin complex protein TccC [Pantoea agglomerans]|uniref:RHS repeat-associated core domain-containing protein n=1 Tax=Enterobacter agglomerans TaxID=549 RepID=UPI0018DA0949|nr:RHS repeat-associated core domain-containing protein [Pantoea agglomerans]